MERGQRSLLEVVVEEEVEDQHWRMRALVEVVGPEDLKSLVMVEAEVLQMMRVEVGLVEHSEEVMVEHCCFDLVEEAEEVQE